MTNQYLARRDLVDRFFSDHVDDAWRRRLLADNSVTYVVWTDQNPRRRQQLLPAQSPLFEPV